MNAAVFLGPNKIATRQVRLTRKEFEGKCLTSAGQGVCGMWI